jgi:PAT family beta-lactamase induction signal transducer AmpG
MGFASGLPLPLTFATLSFWLAEAGVSRTNIGLFVLVGFAYNYKFLWSPVLDSVPIPWLTRRLGRRRSWALVIQALLMVAIFARPQRLRGDLLATAARGHHRLLSPSQDVVIERLPHRALTPRRGPGAAARGATASTCSLPAGALYATAFGGWAFAYGDGRIMLVGMVTVLLTCPAVEKAPPGRVGMGCAAIWARRAIVLPFADCPPRGWLSSGLRRPTGRARRWRRDGTRSATQLGFSRSKSPTSPSWSGFFHPRGGRDRQPRRRPPGDTARPLHRRRAQALSTS